MKRNQVLLVEDSVTIQNLVKYLIESICDLVIADSIEKAKKIVSAKNFSLVLLDVILPDGNGYDFCEQLRKEDQFKDLAIIFLSSKNDIEDRVRGFNLGADDYLAKPIEPKEFVARIESRLKRSRARKVLDELNVGPFRLSTLSQKSYLKIPPESEKELNLTPIEFKLLSNFMRNEEKVIARDEIKMAVWGSSTHVSSHTIDTHISSLRKKIEPCGKYIKSIVKRGYVFSSPNED